MRVKLRHVKDVKLYMKSDSNTVVQELGHLNADGHHALAEIFCEVNDDADDASAVGRWIVEHKIWKKRGARDRCSMPSQPKSNAVNHGPSSSSGKKRKRALYTQSVRSKQADVLILLYDSTENSASLFRTVLRRSRADFSSDKKIRSMYIKGCIIDKERYRVVVVDGNDADERSHNNESFAFDTREVVIPRKKVLPGNETSTKSKCGIKIAKQQPKRRKATVIQMTDYTSTEASRAEGNAGISKQTGQREDDNIYQTPIIEKQHVHEVYDQIADHWDHTRYAPWPRVAEFLQTFPVHSVIGDVGCGNGKYIQKSYLGKPVSAGRFLLGSDRSIKLLGICKERGFDVIHCDNMALPYRSGIFDGVISIAVFHHFSTVPRRLLALRELSRVMKVGGRLLLYAWAQEQDGASRRRFDGPDVLVQWHLRQSTTKNIKNTVTSTKCTDEAPKAVFDRYCHVYVQGELEGLVEKIPSLVVERSYFDASNWAVVAKKILPPGAT